MELVPADLAARHESVHGHLADRVERSDRTTARPHDRAPARPNARLLTGADR
ncbi:hypothetical protein ACFWFZ_26935 [Streptomyces sp. NPDC060232]|uniref:hypothetical protein n=1 Tax=Streptomyces sp. NPDC060232 TaxID=3347079 RepID=UPI00365125D6